VQAILDTVWTPDAYQTEIECVDALLSPRLIAMGMIEELTLMRIRQADLSDWIANRQLNVEAELASAPADVPDVQAQHLCDFGQP